MQNQHPIFSVQNTCCYGIALLATFFMSQLDSINKSCNFTFFLTIIMYPYEITLFCLQNAQLTELNPKAILSFWYNT